MLNYQTGVETLRESPFQLESGETLPSVELAYATYGELNEERSNALLVLHALTGWPAAHEWWSGLIGEGRLLDPSDYFIICPNFLGSCNGSTGPESDDPTRGAAYHAAFPQISIRDIAKACHQLLDTIGISDVAVGIGGSMGGMVLLEMAALHPERFRSIIPIAVSASHTAWRVAFSSIIRKTIASEDPTLQDSAKLTEGLRLARQIATVSYRCATEFDQRFGRQASSGAFAVEHYLEHQGEKIVQRFSPYSYLILTRAMELYDLAEGRSAIEEVARSIECPALFVGISSDVLYGTGEIEGIAGLFPRGEYRTLYAEHGHDSFLVDAEALAQIIAPFIHGTVVTDHEAQYVL